MRVAALYDIHGNLPALEAVLDAVDKAGVDVIVVGGDVLPGPMPGETLARLRDLRVPVRYIAGNGDREVLARMTGTDTAWYASAPANWRAPIDWTAEQLTDPDRDALARWPKTERVELDGIGAVLFCHATPRNDTDCFTRETPDDRLLPLFAGLGVSLAVCGHTHMPFDRQIGDVRVVNAGSVGMPFGAPGADWLLLDTDVRLQHTNYDLAAAAARVHASGYPQAEEFAAGNILEPPAAADMLNLFTRASLRDLP